MIVITGAAGFIGSNLVHELNALGHERLVLVDWLCADGRWQNLIGARFIDFVFPDALTDFLDLRGDEVTAVIHLGGDASTTTRDGDAILRSDLHPSMQLWRWAAAAGKPFIYASSAATYGTGEAGFDDRLGPDALAGLTPLNLHAWSKQAFDMWAFARARECEAPPYWAGLKFFNVYGPRESHKGEMMSVVSKNLDAIRAGQPVRLFKSHRPDVPDGEQMRDFVYVKDCINVILWLARILPNTSGRARNGLYNVGTGTARSFRDLVLAAGAALGRSVDIDYVEMPEVSRGQYQYFTRARMNRLREQGYDAPFHSIEDGIRDLIVGRAAACPAGVGRMQSEVA